MIYLGLALGLFICFGSFKISELCRGIIKKTFYSFWIILCLAFVVASFIFLVRAIRNGEAQEIIHALLFFLRSLKF